MHIRTIQKEDHEAVEAFLRALDRMHVEARPDIYAPTESFYSDEEFDALVANSGERGSAISLVAEEDHTVIGCCFVSIREKSGMIPMKTAYMDDLVVAEDFRRRGIAKALFAEAEVQAKARGAVRMDLNVWAFNDSAKRLYESLGMTPQRFILEKKL
jgi:ribosomal protein S18 acetylase RimI-like enzyme